MKIIAKPIEIVSWTDVKGKINPIRGRARNLCKSTVKKSYLTFK